MTEDEPTVPTASKRGVVVTVGAVVVALLVGGVAGAALRSPKTKIVTNTVTVTSVVTNEVTKNAIPESCVAALTDEEKAVQVLGALVLKLQKDGQSAAINGGTGQQQVDGFIAALQTQNGDMDAALAQLPHGIKDELSSCQAAISN